MRRSIIGLAVSTVSLCLIGQTASAAQDQSAPKSKQPPAPDLLAGPKVEPEATQQRNNPGRPNANAGDQKREIDIPFQQWVGAIRGLGLSQEQQEKARAAVAEFQEATREFQNEHGDAMRQLVSEMREARQNGTEPPKEARDQMRQFEEARPKPDVYKERIWALLNEQQQNQMKEKLEAMRKEMMEKRGDRKDGRRPGAGTNVKDAADKPGEMNEMSGNPSSGEEMMAPPAATDDQSGPAKKPAAEGRTNPQRAPGNWSGATALDAQGRRRMEFLRAHQSLNRAGWAPSNEQRRFDFDDADHSAKKDDQAAPPAPLKDKH